MLLSEFLRGRASARLKVSAESREAGSEKINASRSPEGQNDLPETPGLSTRSQGLF